MTNDELVPEATVEVPSNAAAEPEAESPEEDAESAPAAEKDAESEESKRSRGIERRINRLARERSEARAEAEVLRGYLAQAQQNQGYIPDETPLTRAEMEAEFARRSAQAVEGERVNRVGAKVQAAIRADKELAAAVENSDVEFQPQQLAILRETLDESEHAIGIMKYLALNPDEADRLAEYPPTKFARELGRLEDKVAGLSKKQTSNAPKPLDPVRSTSAVSKDFRPDMSDAAFAAWRRAQIRSRG